MGFNSVLKGLIYFNNKPLQPAASQHSAWLYQLLFIHSPPDAERQACLKHVLAYYWNKWIENSASCWFILYGYITMHGQQNIKLFNDTFYLLFVNKVKFVKDSATANELFLTYVRHQQYKNMALVMPPAWTIHSIDQNCALLGYYTVNSGNSLLILQDGSDGLSWNVGKEPLKTGPMGCPETSVRKPLK